MINDEIGIGRPVVVGMELHPVDDEAGLKGMGDQGQEVIGHGDLEVHALAVDFLQNIDVFEDVFKDLRGAVILERGGVVKLARGAKSGLDVPHFWVPKQAGGRHGGC